MKAITVKKNRLMTMLLTILFCTVIFGSALFVGFGFGYRAAAEDGDEPTAYKYELKGVSVSLNDGWIFTDNTPDDALYKMLRVAVTYTDSESGEDTSRVLDISAGGTAATGESVVFTRETTDKTVTVTVTPSGDDYDPASVDGTYTYTVSAVTPTVNGITAVFDGSTGYEVTTETDLSDGDFIACIKAYEVYNDGSINNGGALSSFSLSGDLFPSVLTADILGGGTYSKAITVIDDEDNTRTASVLVTDIVFVAPDQITGIIGNLQTQVARSTRLNMNGLSVGVSYYSGAWIQVPASAFPANYFSAKYTNASNEEVAVLSTSVKNVELTFTYKKDESTSISAKRSFKNITVSRISIATPIFPDGLNATQTTLSWNGGASIAITGWDYGTLQTNAGEALEPAITVYKIAADNSTQLVSATVDTDVDGQRTVHFPAAAAKYRVNVTLPASDDFMWGSPFNGSKSGDNMTMSYDVQVDKGTPVIELKSIADTVYGTPNDSGTLDATVDGVNMYKNWSEDSTSVGNPYVNESDEWHYRLAYYTDAAATTPVPAADLRDDGRPKKGGTYYAVATTYENSGYESVTSEPCMFKVTPFTVNTTVANKTFARTDWTIDDFFSANNAFPYGDTALSVLTIKEGGVAIDATKTFRHAGSYTVTVSVNETANYKLSGAASVSFAITTDTSSDFDFSVNGWSYGDGGANPNITLTPKSRPYYPSNTGTLTTDYTIKYYKYDDTKPNNKGAEITIPQTSGSDDFSKLEVGRYLVELTANKDAAYPAETAALTAGTNVDYTLPVKYNDFSVAATSIVAPTLGSPWASTADGGLLYTYNDVASGKAYNFTDWIGDGNNTAADGSAIITVTISYVTFVNGTVNSVSLGTGGSFTVYKAGNYTVTVTLNKNYSWSSSAAFVPSGRTYSYYGYVARQKLSVLTDDDIIGTTNVYSGYSQPKTIDKWNDDALQITDITAASLGNGHTPVSGGIVKPTTKIARFEVTNAAKYTVKVDIVDKDNYEWVGATTETEALRTLSLEYTLDRAPMKVTWGTSNLNGTFATTDNTKYLRYEFDGSKAAQSTPTATVSVYGSDVVTIGGYTLYNVTEAGEFGSAIGTVTNVGFYRIVVSSIGGAAAANYYLPENTAADITNIATVFEIYAKTFARPVLTATAGATISGNDITVVYRGSGYRVSDFIQDFSKYTLDGVLRLDIKLGEDGANNPLLTDVLWNADYSQVKAYTINITPIDNYAWSTGDGDQTLVYTITITQKTVNIDWGVERFETTYGEVMQPNPSVSNAEGTDVVTITLGYKQGETVIANADISDANAGIYAAYAAALDNRNYKIDDKKDDYSILFTIKKKVLAQPVLPVGADDGFDGVYGEQVVAADGYDWNDYDGLVSVAVSGVIPTDWFRPEDTAVLTVDGASFDVKTGTFSYTRAGEYTFTVSLDGYANYCFDDSYQIDFICASPYTYTAAQKYTVNRKRLAAPDLSENRAQEWDNVTPISFGSAIDGVTYSVKYGNQNDVAATYESWLGGEGASGVRGIYYAELTLNASNPLNYVWVQNPDDTLDGLDYVDNTYATYYYGASKVAIRLYYAITSSQLDVSIKVNNYAFGDNGIVNGVNGTVSFLSSALTTDASAVVYIMGSGTSVAVGKYAPKLTNYLFIDENGNGVIELINGLPWAAGKYTLKGTVTFGEDNTYQPKNVSVEFYVLPREIEVEWSNTTFEYDNNTHMATAAITTVIKKSGDDDTDYTDGLTLVITMADDTTDPKNAGGYTVKVASITAEDGVKNNFAVPENLSTTLTITAKAVTVNAAAVAAHVYRDLITDGEKQFTANEALFTEDGAADFVDVKIVDDNGTEIDRTAAVGTYFVVVGWKATAGFHATNYDAQFNNATFVIVRRTLTVEFVADNAQSVYGDEVDLYNAVKPIYNVTACKGTDDTTDALGGLDAAAVFSFVCAADADADVGKYAITKAAKDSGFDITFVGDAWEYEIVNAAIEDDDTICGIPDTTYCAANINALQDGYAVRTVKNTLAKWEYAFVTSFDVASSAVSDWIDFATVVPTVYGAGDYCMYVMVTAANHDPLIKQVTVHVDKAELTVKFDLTIMFGEENPASLQYLFGLKNLRTENIGWTVDGFAGSDEALFYADPDQESFYGLAGNAEYSVADYDKTSLATQYNISFIAKNGETDALTCDNYTFVGEVGKLTVKAVEITVTINDLTVTYNEPNVTDIPDVNVENVGYTVTLAKSTYDNSADYAKSETAYSDIFTISTTAHDGKIATSTTGNAGSYAIVGSALLDGKYTVKFVGGWTETLAAAPTNGTCGKYTINPAALTVNNTIADYTGVYDEKWHGIVVDGANTVESDGTPVIGVVLATASDGTEVAVEYRVSTTQLAVLNENEFKKLTLSATAPKYRDVGRYYVYYSLSNSNYTTVLQGRRVVITIGDNELSTAFNFENNTVVSDGQTALTAWTYGYMVEDGFNPAEGFNKVVEPSAKFKYTGNGNEVGKVTFTLYYNENSIWTKTVDADAADTVTNMFAQLFAADGLNAGSYKLAVSMEDAKNYNGFTTVYIFDVAKRELTVKAATPDDVTYGSAAPAFTDDSVGLVVNNSKAGAVADSIETALGAAPNYVTTYKQGDNAGVSYRVYVSGKGNNELDGASFTNYTVKYVDVNLDVIKRVITVNIADKENTFNLRGDNNTTEEIQTLTFTVTGGSIYSAELVAGAPEDGVYTNANQTVLTLCTEAIVGDNTNNVKFDGNGKVTGYTVYAVFNGAAATNYQIDFAGCALRETGNGAIGSDGSSNNAGSYTIKKATFSLIQDGVYHNVGDEKVKGTVYSGAANYYVATLDDKDKTPLEFTYTKKGSDGSFTEIDADQVVEVGEYQAIGSSVNPNYTAANLTIGFTITKATLTLTADATEVQYGTTLSGVVATDKAVGGAESTGRFKGFTFTSSSPTLLDDTLSEYLENNTVGYTLAGYNASTNANTTCTITPACASDSNVNVVTVGADLKVIKRSVTVTMVGWDEANSGDIAKHNVKAWCYYVGSNPLTNSALQSSFTADITSYIYIADETVVFGDSGDNRAALGITVSLPNGSDVGEYAIGYEAQSANYSVSFTNTDAPKFCVKKARLTLTAYDATYTYGETIQTLVDGAVYSVGKLTYSVDGMQNGQRFVNFLDNRNIVFTIVDNGGNAYEAWVSPVGTYTVGIMMREGENEYNPTAATFKNYEIVEIETATLTLTKRKISAATTDQVFGFDGTTYNGGKFGKSHNAQIMFNDVFGNDANVDSDEYRPSFTLLYNTAKIDNYQTAGAAPTVVGKYKVTVTLGANSNYTFDGGNSSVIDFEVTKLVIHEADLGWNTVSYSMDDLIDEQFTNYINNYVNDYFSVIRFVYTSATGVGTQIAEGDVNTLDTYYFDNQKMYITFGRNIGTYTLSFTLKDSALGNLALDTAIVGEATVSFSVRQDAVTMAVEMENFTYGDQPSKVTVIVNGSEAAIGLTLAYAPVTSANAADFAATSKLNQGLENVNGLTYGALSNATNFNAGYYVLSAEYKLNEIISRRYYVFQVYKRVVAAPQDSIAAAVFNGSAQSVAIDYQTAYMRPEFTAAGGSFAAANGTATFTATAVGTYYVKFILIDPANNVWNTDSATGEFSDRALTLTWNITKDDSGNGEADDPIVALPQSIDNITYGGAFDTDLIVVKDGYDGRITLYRLPKTDDNMPSADLAAESWTEYDVDARGIDAGDYWLLVVLSDLTGRNFAPKATVGSFTIVPKTITAAISGTMVYGTALADTDFGDVVINGLIAGDKATIGDYSYGYAKTYANLNAGGEYEIILDTDNSGAVIGIYAGANYKVTAARGTLTITKRAVTVTIESKESDYSVTPDLSDVQYSAIGLAAGEDKSVLGIVFETDATGKSAAGGTYWITIKTYDGTNYVVTQHRALYVVNPLEIEVELVRQQNIKYGDSDIKGATAGDIKITNTKADEAFVRGDLQLVIRFTDSNGYDSFDVPVNAGTYTATLVGANANYKLIGTPSIDFVIDKKEVDVSAFYINSATYTGKEIAPVVEVKKQGSQAMYDPSVYAVGACAFTDAGRHNVTVSLADPSNYVWSSTTDAAVTLVFVIDKANDVQTDKLVIAGWQYSCYDVNANSPSAAVKSGQRITYQYSADGKVFTNVVPENGNAGTYYVRVTVAESQNYLEFIGEPVRFEIAKFVVASPSLTVVTDGNGKNDVYTGDTLSSGIVGFNPQLMQIAYDGSIQSLGDSVSVFARDAGTYTVYISLFNAHNYCWSVGDEDSDGTLALTWSVARKKIAKPTNDSSTKIVNGNTIVYIPIGFDADIMTIQNNAYSYGGTFSAKIMLKDTKNYEWATGGDAPFTIKWSIVGADTVFNVIISILSVLAAAGCALILVQFLLNKHQKRVTESAMRDIENNSATPATEKSATEQPAEEKPAEEQLKIEQSAEEKPAEEQPKSEQPMEEKPAEEKPKAKRGRKPNKPAEGNEGGAK